MSILTKHRLQFVLLSLFSLLAVIPFAWLLSTALKSSDENIFAYPPHWLPAKLTFDNFQSVWQQVPLGAFVLNSLVVGALTVLFNITFSTLAAYPLARMSFRGEKGIWMVILSTMMLPFQVIMIPLYLMMLHLGLADIAGSSSTGLEASIRTWLGQVIPFVISGFGIFFVRDALVSLPRDLEESAVLDGCNSWDILWRILIPLIRPTLATLAVFSFMASWGEFLWPSILLSEPEHFTLPLGLVQLQSAFSANWRLIAAGTTLSMLPIIVFFLLMQRYFVSTDVGSGVKG